MVGAGISGLTAALDLARAGRQVILVEATDRVGGKIRRGEVAGIAVDVGAEAMINRRPEGVDLTRSLGLELTHPSSATSRIWTRDALRPLPRTLLGAPLDLDQLRTAGLLSDEGLARALREPELPPTAIADDADISVGDLIDQRYGEEVTDRLVEPLLGGVYAGHARAISVRAAMPQLLTLATRGSIAAQAGSAPQASASNPVFAGIPGGMWQLADALRDAFIGAGGQVHTGATVTGLLREEGGFRIDISTAQAASSLAADAVVLATPAAATARLLGDIDPEAAADLAQIDYASMAVITLAFRAAHARQHLDTGASGFLVPPIDGRAIKAATFSFAKWDWVRAAGAEASGDELLLLRTSIGRVGEEAGLQVEDDELIARSLADLRTATGLDATPADALVQRWGGGLPQYAVGHRDRVDRIKAAIAQVPGLAVCGAAYDGVGVAPCIASGHAAAEAVIGESSG